MCVPIDAAYEHLSAATSEAKLLLHFSKPKPNKKKESRKDLPAKSEKTTKPTGGHRKAAKRASRATTKLYSSGMISHMAIF